MPAFIAALRARRGGRSVSVADRALIFGETYALERADRLGMMNSVMVSILPFEDSKRVRSIAMSKLEKRLREIAVTRLCSSDGRVSELLGEDALSFVERQRDARVRIRMYGAALQTEYWLKNYPLLVK